jgi:hypothetical protein
MLVRAANTLNSERVPRMRAKPDRDIGFPRGSTGHHPEYARVTVETPDPTMNGEKRREPLRSGIS